MTYDRSVIKLDETRLRDMNSKLYSPPATTLPILLSSERDPQTWKFRTDAPSSGWEKPGFNDSQWQIGAAPFADNKGPFYPLGSQWSQPEIWMRKSFQLTHIPPMLTLQTAHDIDRLELYINGIKIMDLDKERDKLRGHTSRHYQYIDISAYTGVLKEGQNVIAVKASKAAGERLIDVGLFGIWPYPIEASTCDNAPQPSARPFALAVKAFPIAPQYSVSITVQEKSDGIPDRISITRKCVAM
jgi:hypothetical protein